MANPIKNKNILLGVTGSIAAYKAVDLASKLTQAGAAVDVILTASAQQFVTPLSFQSVTGRKAFTDADLWSGEGHVVHVGLGRAGDLFVIAPVSANTIAKLAHGTADNLLSVAALAARCPIVLAPAMDAGMYSHPATQANVEILLQRGVTILGPAAGHLASGLVGVGRMVEPAEILGNIRCLLGRKGDLSGRKLVITAGGTQEAIDPVRMITNRSSGKQGYALAQAALDCGADVILITAPTILNIPCGCKAIQVTTAAEMLTAVMKEIPRADVLIMAAAVADFRPVEISQQKIKKQSGIPEIRLESTPDILGEVARQKKITGYPRKLVGFAAESQNLIENAHEKMRTKDLDLIIANDITAHDSGFEVETNKVTLLFPDGNVEKMDLMTKEDVAEKIIDQVIQWG